MINHERSRGQRVHIDPLYSSLTLPAVSPADSGNYTCSPEHLTPASIAVHILEEGSNSAAAIQDNDEDDVASSSSSFSSSPSSGVSSYSSITVILLLLLNGISRTLYVEV